MEPMQIEELYLEYQIYKVEQDIFVKGQQFVVRFKHSVTCTYYLAEMDFHGEISLVDTDAVLDDEYKIEIR